MSQELQKATIPSGARARWAHALAPALAALTLHVAAGSYLGLEFIAVGGNAARPIDVQLMQAPPEVAPLPARRATLVAATSSSRAGRAGDALSGSLLAEAAPVRITAKPKPLHAAVATHAAESTPKQPAAETAAPVPPLATPAAGEAGAAVATVAPLAA